MSVYTQTPSSSSVGSSSSPPEPLVEEEGGVVTIPSLLKLPPEIIDHLLSVVSAEHRQLTTLALTRVFPGYEISLRNLWRHVIIYNSKQLWPLWRKLKSNNESERYQHQHDQDEDRNEGTLKYAREIRSFSMKSWKGDADILNNALRCIPTNSPLHTILLNIGTNFAPDHLEELFENPRQGIRRLEMRFRPYVEQASYYQFLAGSYFDTAVETLTKRWPSLPTFTHLSIVQDLPPRSTVPPTAINSTSTSLAGSFADLSLAKKDGEERSSSDSENNSGRSTPPTSISSASENPLDIGTSKAYTGHGPFGNPFLNEKLGITKPKTFAQPIVFFDINCIAKVGASPVAEHLTHLRLRVPSRDLLRVLINPPRGSGTMFPKLQYLDISTTNVRIDTNLTTLLRTYTNLEHLILDHVNLFGFTARDKGPELCHDLGGLVVSAGLARGKERERQIAAWELAERTRFAEAEASRIRAQRIAAEQERIQNGGDDDDVPADILAEIARRERIEEQQRAIVLARSRRGHRSAAQSTFSLRDRSRRTGGSSAAGGSGQAHLVDVPPPDKLYMVLPPLPKLRSISIGGEASGVSKDKVLEWEKEFHQGWKEGLNKLLGWAVHIADKYERARRKADEWRAQELRSSGHASTSSNSTASSSSAAAKNGHVSKSKRRASISNGSGGKASTASASVSNKPPLDIRLFRFPTSEEIADMPSEESVPGPHDLTAGLIEIESSEANHREYLDVYKQAIGDLQLLESGQGESWGNLATCVLCTVPDCEGPARRGAEGERVDGRGGMSGAHKEGCGHALGRKIWGYAGLED
ncbi:uncharacterized protein I303_103010 [Kwoniella dejecticola CBS 10117]|uniref:F-box domain-containing protein n=1 Tax=Kwoniella dejecticola CBS 10117 TaxID=1296121 RepID=A0A1A6AAC4_9TREE|nr:uncharacterized protein I303_03029 [Kwoniella dejecticola CBS 10117]OBR87007.1 hypothetical protein I303_03029 [Kwoniella dejecticola CBS 10117]